MSLCRKKICADLNVVNFSTKTNDTVIDHKYGHHYDIVFACASW